MALVAAAPLLPAALAAPVTEGNMFTLTDAHLRALRGLIVVWSPVEAGAPGLLVSWKQLESEDGALPADAPPDLSQALAQFMQRAKLPPGRYSYPNPLAGRGLELMLPPPVADLGHRQTVDFEFTAHHDRLLRHLQWRGLLVDPKRPYGDMTYFELDMARILGDTVARGADGAPALTEQQTRRYERLHAQMISALQVFLREAQLAPGQYERLPE